jgi:hypothetical protein
MYTTKWSYTEVYKWGGMNDGEEEVKYTEFQRWAGPTLTLISDLFSQLMLQNRWSKNPWNLWTENTAILT